MIDFVKKTLTMSCGAQARSVPRLSIRVEKPVGRVTEPVMPPINGGRTVPEAPQTDIPKVMGKEVAETSKQMDTSMQNAIPKEEPLKYRVLDKGAIGGIAVYGANPRMQQAYRRFCRDGLGMGEFMPVTIPGGMGKLMSPLALKMASDLLGCISELIESGEVSRVVCIAQRKDLDIPIIKHLVSVPDGKDFAAHVLSLGRATVKRRLGIDVEFYLAEVKEDGEVEFYKLG